MLALTLDASEPTCVVQGPDGQSQACRIEAWFRDGDEKPITSHILADYFTINVHGVDKDGDPATSRYDVRMQGIGPEIRRDAYGTFTSREGARMEQRLMETAARLPSVFDKQGA